MNIDRTFLDQFESYFKRIDDQLNSVLTSDVPLVKDIGEHSLLGEGKRLRPLLFVLSCQLCGYDREDMYRFSTVFEYMHTASLLHDDVLDDAAIRRKKPSAKQVWGNLAAVLGGDYFYAKSSEIAVSSNNFQFMERVADMTTRMVEGQFFELVNTHNWRVSKDDYFRIIVAKTAELISAACACGAIIAGSGQSEVDSLSQFGLNAGIAFQLIDDVLDYTSCVEEFGKPVGKDLKEGKITLPLIYSLADLKTEEIERLQVLFKSEEADERDHGNIVDMVRGNGVIDRIRSEARGYLHRAEGFLGTFPESDVKDNLLALNGYIIDRNF